MAVDRLSKPRSRIPSLTLTSANNRSQTEVEHKPWGALRIMVLIAVLLFVGAKRVRYQPSHASLTNPKIVSLAV
jgi:hypothetical protein